MFIGLAASLQDHMMASRKFKEEHEERQRRSIVSANHVDAYSNQYHQHQSTHGVINGPIHQNGIPTVKMEVGLKRASPLTVNQTRPPKMAHYSHEAGQNHHHPQQQQPNQQISVLLHHNVNNQTTYANTNGSLHSPSSTTMHLLSSTHRPLEPQQPQQRKKLPIESLLMSPEINSIMGDERVVRASQPLQQQQPQQAYHRNHHQQQQQQQQQQLQQTTILMPHHMQHQQANSRSTPISVGTRADDGKNFNEYTETLSQQQEQQHLSQQEAKKKQQTLYKVAKIDNTISTSTTITTTATTTTTITTQTNTENIKATKKISFKKKIKSASATIITPLAPFSS